MDRAQIRRLSKIANEIHGKRNTRIPVVRYFGVKGGQVHITNQYERHVEPIQGVPDCVIPPGVIHMLALQGGDDDTQVSVKVTPDSCGHEIKIRDDENNINVSAKGLPLDEFPFRDVSP